MAIFQGINDNLVRELEGTVAYLYDIFVVSRTEEELQIRIERLLKRIMKYCFHLRSEKCLSFLKSIKYLGFIFDSDSDPDSEYIRAIMDRPLPTDVTTLRPFWGSIIYPSNFLPSLSEVRGPLT